MEIYDFKGLRTAVANPPANTAKVMQNFLRHHKRGELWEGVGYAKKYASLPNPTNIVWKDIWNFYVNEHGGKNITVAVGTYRVLSTDGGATLDRFGIWVRPYWDGAAWQDVWRELTECVLTRVASYTAPNRINIDNNLVFVYAADYFKHWTLVFVDYSQGEDANNYLLVTASGQWSVNDYVDVFGVNTDFSAARPANTRILLVRSFVNKELPSSLTSFIYSLLNEIRLTSGNTSTDVGLMAGFRTKTWGWSLSLDRLLVDAGSLDIWRNAFGIASITDDVGADALAAGTYHCKETLVLDDGSETELRHIDAKTNVVSDGTKRIKFRAMVSAGALMNRARHVRLYLSNNNNTFYRVKDIALDDTVVYDKQYGAKLADPATLPSGQVRSIAFSPDGNYVAMALLASPYIAVYNWSASGFGAKVADPATLPAGVGREVEWSPNGAYIAIAHTTTPFITVYNWAAGFGAKVADPATLPPADCFGVRWSPSGSYIAVATQASPNIVVYNWAAGFGAKVADPATLPPGVGQAVSWSPDGKYILVTLSVTPYVNAYSWSAGFGGKLDDPASGLSGTSFACRFSTDGKYVLFGEGVSPYVGAYEWANGFGKRLTNPAILPTGVVQNIAFTPDGKLVGVAHTTTPFVTVYGWYRGFAGRMENAAMLPAGNGQAIGFSNSGAHVVVGHATTPFVTGYPLAASAYYYAILQHYYHRTLELIVGGSDWTNAGAEASVQLGRAVTDTGVVRFGVGAVAGNKAFVANALVGTTLIGNKVFVCAVSGDGDVQWDVFPNDVEHVVNVEYNDGDEIVALGPLRELLLVLKQRSLVLVKQRNDGGFDRELVTRADGIASAKSLTAFDDVLYWAGYNGVYSYDTRRGWRWLNQLWWKEWADLTQAQKEAAAGVVDREERQYRLAAAGQEWIIDLDDEEAMVGNLVDQPLAYATEPKSGATDFLSGVLIQTLGGGTRHDGANFTANYESVKTTALNENEMAEFDLVVQGFTLLYESDVSPSLDLYLDDDTVSVKTFGANEGLTAANKKVTVYVPVELNTRCKFFRWKVTGVTTANDQKLRVKRVMPIVERVPAFGDVLVSTL